MTKAKLKAIALASTLGVLCACSKSAPNAADATAAQAAATKPVVQPGSACDRKLVTAQAVAGILAAPITGTKNIPGDPQSCEFLAAGFSSVTISVRPGHGKAAVGAYTSGKMNDYEKSEPLAGVGDEAVRSLELNRVVARKGDLLCEITGPGMAKAAGDPVTLKLGALCNSIFAAE
ncbi:MAG: hypothetical protein P4L92_01765 [Rudaea sp.]|nr:hypothetical protein [Rudaea sp.]